MRAWAAGGLPGRGKEAEEGTFQMIEARGRSRRYGHKVAFEDLSFTVRPGHVTGFLGPNGAGRTTTMRTILGLGRPAAGSVTVNDLGPARVSLEEAFMELTADSIEFEAKG
jgi:ABC-type multidrug transport system ATPase subunit